MNLYPEWVNPLHGDMKNQTTNPWNMVPYARRRRVQMPGGSKGGSAVVSSGIFRNWYRRIDQSSGISLLGSWATCGPPSSSGISLLGSWATCGPPSLDHISCVTRSAWRAAAVLECLSWWMHQISRKNVPQYTKIFENSNVEQVMLILLRKILSVITNA